MATVTIKADADLVALFRRALKSIKAVAAQVRRDRERVERAVARLQGKR
jgi:hypothetical protein